jgi:hypothetical protein
VPQVLLQPLQGCGTQLQYPGQLHGQLRLPLRCGCVEQGRFDGRPYLAHNRLEAQAVLVLFLGRQSLLEYLLFEPATGTVPTILQGIDMDRDQAFMVLRSV